MSWLDILRKGENHSEQTSDSSDWWTFCCSDADAAKEPEKPQKIEQELYQANNSNRGQMLRNFKWSAEEDALLKRLVYELKFDWETMARYFPGKIPSQVAKRWINKLDPSIKKLRWTSEEDDIILSMISRIGHNWKEISKHLEGRPPDAVKSRFHSNLRKRLENKEHLSLEDLDPDSFLSLKDDTTSPTMNMETSSPTHTDTKTNSSLGNMFSQLTTDTKDSHKDSSSEVSTANPSPKNCDSSTASINPSPKSSMNGSSTNHIKLNHVPNGTDNHANGGSSMTREQKREILKELRSRVQKLQNAIVETSDQINKLEDEIFGSESEI
jgi:hypothetical protein